MCHKHTVCSTKMCTQILKARSIESESLELSSENCASILELEGNAFVRQCRTDGAARSEGGGYLAVERNIDVGGDYW